nr:hypothetical protein [Tanacetum cinerariifolium]
MPARPPILPGRRLREQRNGIYYPSRDAVGAGVGRYVGREGSEVAARAQEVPVAQGFFAEFDAALVPDGVEQRLAREARNVGQRTGRHVGRVVRRRLGGGFGLHEQDVGVAHLANILARRLGRRGPRNGHFAAEVARGAECGVYRIGDPQHHIPTLNEGYFPAGVVGLKLVVQALGRVIKAVAKSGAVIL